jgi:hypothetical protein
MRGAAYGLGSLAGRMFWLLCKVLSGVVAILDGMELLPLRRDATSWA